MISNTQRIRMGLPIRVFLYTDDQIADLLRLPLAKLRKESLWFDGREVGLPPGDKIRAVNIMAAGLTPQWRVAEDEFVRWLKHKQINILP